MNTASHWAGSTKVSQPAVLAPAAQAASSS